MKKRVSVSDCVLLGITLWIVVSTRRYPIDHCDCCHWCSQRSACCLPCNTWHPFFSWECRHNTVLCGNITQFPGILIHTYRRTISHTHKPGFLLLLLLLLFWRTEFSTAAAHEELRGLSTPYLSLSAVKAFLALNCRGYSGKKIYDSEVRFGLGL